MISNFKGNLNYFNFSQSTSYFAQYQDFDNQSEESYREKTYERAKEPRALVKKSRCWINVNPVNKNLSLAKAKKRPIEESDEERDAKSEASLKTENRNVFRLASYNLLSQELLNRNINLYSNCFKTHLDWNYRQDKLWNEIKRFNFEVFCDNFLSSKDFL